jgi:hypothetical protein
MSAEMMQGAPLIVERRCSHEYQVFLPVANCLITVTHESETKLGGSYMAGLTSPRASLARILTNFTNVNDLH